MEIFVAFTALTNSVITADNRDNFTPNPYGLEREGHPLQALPELAWS